MQATWQDCLTPTSRLVLYYHVPELYNTQTDALSNCTDISKSNKYRKGDSGGNIDKQIPGCICGA